MCPEEVLGQYKTEVCPGFNQSIVSNRFSGQYSINGTLSRGLFCDITHGILQIVFHHFVTHGILWTVFHHVGLSRGLFGQCSIDPCMHQRKLGVCETNVGNIGHECSNLVSS